MCTIRRLVAPAMVMALGVVLTTTAHGQSDQVAADIALIKARPKGMGPDDWSEQRRNAARNLGNTGDKRAVPVLIDVVRTEKFDAISEIAIEALGKLGDRRAVDVLVAVRDDRSRDRYVRRLARAALKKLGHTDDEPPATPQATTHPQPAAKQSRVATSPRFPEDTLGVREELTLALGSSSLAYDTLRDRPTFDGDVALHYQRAVDRQTIAFRYGGDARVITAFVDYDGNDTQSKSISLSASGDAEARSYLKGRRIYGFARGAAVVSAVGLRTDVPEPDTDREVLVVTSDLHLALGGGFGRVLAAGEGLRLRRLQEVLSASKMLGRPIGGDLAERVLAAWWTLRGEQGAHDRLVTTVALLREAGVLLDEPDASTTYRMLQVLLDGQLDHRLSGLDVSFGLAESYLLRDEDLPLQEGRVESLVVQAQYGNQLANNRELVGDAFARYRVLAASDVPSPWAMGIRLAYRQYHYNVNFDPIGGLELAGELRLSDDDLADTSRSNLGSRLAVSAGWLWVQSRASRFRLAGSMAFESGEWFAGISFVARYGFLDLGYLGAASYAALP